MKRLLGPLFTEIILITVIIECAVIDGVVVSLDRKVW